MIPASSKRISWMVVQSSLNIEALKVFEMGMFSFGKGGVKVIFT